ncbi:hypothetical protein BLNAU_23861 [Blattamonas nauphoetae]|uniref:Uncharacterized protein n=1 Tax=Blattamonas nauphoetae TaxID=2049346 RepID=A0ABQ9WP23_9EUKA|nr:hypothetical protein BLNAU_23861 [Blattamonas nauphoetae]
MFTSKEYTPFLKWNPNDPKTVESVSAVFLSLVSMASHSLSLFRKILEDDGSKLHRLRPNHCGIDECAGIVIPSLNIH